jgi:hypothetical protein
VTLAVGADNAATIWSPKNEIAQHPQDKSRRGFDLLKERVYARNPRVDFSIWEAKVSASVSYGTA